MTPANERKAKERQAKRKAGLVPVEVWVPKGMEVAIRDKAEIMRNSLQVTATPLTNPPT